MTRPLRVAIYARFSSENQRDTSIDDQVRVAFSMKAMMSDWYLEDLRDKTLRGLQGQALRGFSTGGLPLGYVTEPIGDPRKPDGHRPRIDEASAALVVRIFEMYRDGLSYMHIAKTLNHECIPSPRAGSTNTRGWVASTIREMLRNESYIGRWTYGRRQWKKVPGTNDRRPRTRSSDEVMRFDRPELRIVPQELWDAVKARRGAVARKYTGATDGGRAPGRRTNYPFSGLLTCGACGAPMVIMGGSNDRYYRCGDVHKRGTCSNRLSVRESVIRKIIFDELERVLASDLGVTYARRRLAEKLGELSRSVNQERTRVKKQIAKIEKQLDQLVAFVRENTGEGAALVPVRESLAALQTQREGLQLELETLANRAARPVVIPTPEEVRAVVFDLKKLLGTDPVRAREALRRFLKNGTIVLDPQEDNTYLAKGELLPLMVIPARKAKPRSSPTGAAVYIDGCAGRI